MADRIHLNGSVVERLRFLLKNTERELCQLLIGTRHGPQLSVVSQIGIPTTTPTRFWVSAADWRRAGEWAAGAGMTIVALLHSHPSGHRSLSDQDRRGLSQSAVPWVLATEEPKLSFSAWSPSGEPLEVHWEIK